MKTLASPPIVVPMFPASKPWFGLLLLTEGATLVVLVLLSTGCADTERGIRERARREQSSMDGGEERERK